MFFLVTVFVYNPVANQCNPLSGHRDWFWNGHFVQSEWIQGVGQKSPGRDAFFPLDLNPELLGTCMSEGPAPTWSQIERLTQEMKGGQVLRTSLKALGVLNLFKGQFTYEGHCSRKGIDHTAWTQRTGRGVPFWILWTFGLGLIQSAVVER